MLLSFYESCLNWLFCFSLIFFFDVCCRRTVHSTCCTSTNRWACYEARWGSSQYMHKKWTLRAPLFEFYFMFFVWDNAMCRMQCIVLRTVCSSVSKHLLLTTVSQNSLSYCPKWRSMMRYVCSIVLNSLCLADHASPSLVACSFSTWNEHSEIVCLRGI